jgi:hypothetical protein
MTLENATTLDINIVGLQTLLSDLRRYDKDLYKFVAAKLKTSAQPLATKIGAAFPAQAPLERWHETGRKGRSRLPGYSGSKARRGVKPIVYSGSNRFVGKNVGILRIQQMDAGGAVFDGAGSAMGNPKGNQFIANLDKRSAVKSRGNGKRSRVMFVQTLKNLPIIEGSVAKAIDELNDLIVNNLAKAA